MADGWSVVITDRQAERGKAFAEKLTAAGAEIEVVILDITEPEAPEKAVQAALKRFGRRDGLVTMRGSA